MIITIKPRGIGINWSSMEPYKKYFISTKDLLMELEHQRLSGLNLRAKELGLELFYYEVFEGYVIELKKKLMA